MTNKKQPVFYQYVVQTADYVCQNEINVRKLKEGIVGHFAQTVKILSLLESFQNYSDFDQTNFITCQTKCCKNLLKQGVIHGILNGGEQFADTDIGFGTFLAFFAKQAYRKVQQGSIKLKWSTFNENLVLVPSLFKGN